MSKLEPRKNLLKIQSYKAGESKLAGFEKSYKLASNEGAFGAPPSAMKAYKEFDDLHIYPEGLACELREALAQKHGFKAEEIICGAGSDELIHLICTAYAGPDTEVLYPAFAFSMYSLYARVSGAEPVTTPKDKLTVSVDDLLNAVTPKTRVVFVANPANPTSTYISEAEMRRLRDNLPENILLVIDSAYAEFVDKPDYESGAKMVQDYDNVIMLRTFSKIYALSALRIGWGYAKKEIIDVLAKVKPPFNLAMPAQVAAKEALKDDDFVAKSKAHNDKWLTILKTELPKIGLQPVDSVCNFVLVKFPEHKNAQDADAYLRSKGIIARSMIPYELSEYLRISIGSEEAMTYLMEVIKAYMS